MTGVCAGNDLAENLELSSSCIWHSWSFNWECECWARKFCVIGGGILDILNISCNSFACSALWRVRNNYFPSSSGKYMCADLLGSQLSPSHECSHLNQLDGCGPQPRKAQIPVLPAHTIWLPATKAIFFPLIKLTKQVLQDVLISVSRWLPPSWHSGGLPGTCQRTPVSIADGFTVPQQQG